MPHHKSAAKRVRQNDERRERNRMHRSAMRTMMRKLLRTTDKSEAETLLPKIESTLDRLASKGVLHKNRAAHYKSRLGKHVKRL